MDVERDLASIRLGAGARWSKVTGVALAGGGADGVPVEPIRRFLRDFVVQGNRSGSVRSYGYGLLRWWRWLLCTLQCE